MFDKRTLTYIEPAAKSARLPLTNYKSQFFLSVCLSPINACLMIPHWIMRGGRMYVLANAFSSSSFAYARPLVAWIGSFSRTSSHAWHSTRVSPKGEDGLSQLSALPLLLLPHPWWINYSGAAIAGSTGKPDLTFKALHIMHQKVISNSSPCFLHTL